jgi:hypothetical protein
LAIFDEVDHVLAGGGRIDRHEHLAANGLGVLEHDAVRRIAMPGCEGV